MVYCYWKVKEEGLQQGTKAACVLGSTAVTHGDLGTPPPGGGGSFTAELTGTGIAREPGLNGSSALAGCEAYKANKNGSAPGVPTQPRFGEAPWGTS